jgi:hypothetical protein
MAHERQSRPNSGLDFQTKVIKTFHDDASWLGSGTENHHAWGAVVRRAAEREREEASERERERDRERVCVCERERAREKGSVRQEAMAREAQMATLLLNPASPEPWAHAALHPATPGH